MLGGMRIWLSLAAIGLGVAVAAAVMASGRFDVWSVAIAVFLVAGGVRLWHRRQIRDGLDD